MPTETHLNRRQFLKAATALSLVSLSSCVSPGGRKKGPNELITMGFIGVGKQGAYLMGGFLHNKETKILAVCDVDTTRREHCKKTVEDYYSKQANSDYKGCAAYTDFRELLARKDIDAVCIAAPDHWHALTAVAAADAGKDIYCEKPLSLTIYEARAMVNAARRNKRVFQTGSMQRSSREFLQACEAVRNGLIGKVQKVLVGVGGPSQWCDLPEETMEPGLDWDFWLGPAPKRPYNSILSPRGVHDHFPHWRNYREYSGGGMTDWGAHHFDIAQWGLGMDESGPVQIIPPSDPKSNSGVKFIYANGVEMVHGGPGGATFIGEKGEVFVTRGKWTTKPESIKEEKIPENGIHLYKSSNHLQDFLNCVRSRQRPICDVEIGARSVTVCHLGNLAYWNRRALKWDPAKEQFLGDDEANTWLNPPKHAPWKV